MSGEQHRSETLFVVDGIPHIVQESSWDCGLACLRMSLRLLRPDIKESDILTACKMHNLAQSVWTIDLAYLSSILGVPHLFCTQTLGVDKSYKNESFYQKEMRSDFDEEELRVNKLFAEASENKVNVEKRSVQIEEIIDHLTKQQPVIVLINDSERYLRYSEKNITTNGENSCCQSFWDWFCCFRCCGGYTDIEEGSRNVAHGEPAEEYWGHFVVIVGYDPTKKIFILNDPSPSGRHAQCSFETFDRARKSFGTDEDILFMFTSPG